MRLYLVDGYVSQQVIKEFESHARVPHRYVYEHIIDAHDHPVRWCLELFRAFATIEDSGFPYNRAVLTNCVDCLTYAGKCYDGRFDVFLWVPSKSAFCRVDELTDRHLRQGNNILKLYLNGEFDVRGDY